MVATVRNLTSSSSTAEYFRADGGYYVGEEGDEESLRAKREEHREASAWHGKGAELLGLKPGARVAAGKFEKLLRGEVLGTGIRLGRIRNGEHEHRPGFDLTFSAPKSVSLAALLPTEDRPKGDRAVIRAHDAAVRETLDWVEATLLQTRGWDPETRTRPRENAPFMVAATFRHIASRNLDPQLHTHAVIANVTRGADGKWKSVDPVALHRNARLIGAYYRDRLARNLIGRGYSIVPAMAGRIPSFEIAGFGKALCAAFSTRRREILAYVEERGWDGTEAAKQVASLATRGRKAEPLRSLLREVWRDRAEALGFGGQVTHSPQPMTLPPVPSALEIVGRSMRHLEERQPVFAERDLEALALGHSPGRYTIGEIKDAVAWMVRDGHLVEANLRGSDRSWVTDRTLKAERKTIAAMKAGLGEGKQLATEEEVSACLGSAGLTAGQAAAVRTILLSDDRTVGVQGRAGTGKTTMLRQVRELAGERPVVGLAPSAAAARVLGRETGMNGRTLQWFLTRCQAAGGDGKAMGGLKELFGGSIVVLDESSMVSTEQMGELMRIVDRLGVARLVLVGDTAQLKAVDAGQPFLQLQRAGMATAEMDDILRQRNPELRRAVVASLMGEPGKAVELLKNSVHEVAYEELGEKAARTWLALAPETRANTLLLAPTHALRAEIDTTVREALSEEGVLRGRPLTIHRLVSLGMTRAEKGDARNYREGDVVVFHQDMKNYRVNKDEALTVSGIDGDRVTLAHPDGGPRHIEPAGRVRYRLDVFETRPIEIRTGDRIRWTRNDHGRNLINGERAEVLSIHRKKVKLRLEDGREISLKEDDPQLRHIDYAWSSTVHGAQGATADGVIAVLDSSHRALTDQSTFYVEISRARDNAVVLTDNLDELVAVLEENTGEKATALAAAADEIGLEIDIDALARNLPRKAPVWTPGEEWAALETRARREGTVAFLAAGYDDLIARARKLAERPDLPAAVRETLDGIFAYDLACREGDGTAREFAGLLQEHFVARRGLEEVARAEKCAVAALDDYADWWELSTLLIGNGAALLADLGAQAGDAGAAIREGLDRLPVLHALDDAHFAFETLRDEVNERATADGTIPYYSEGHDVLLGSARALAGMAGLPGHAREAATAVIEEADACDTRRAEVRALRGDVDLLLDERTGMETGMTEVPANRLVPPTERADYADWSARSEAAETRWQAMQREAETWTPHLDRLAGGKAALEADVARLGNLRGHDWAWSELHAMRGEIVDRATAERVAPFDLPQWGAFADSARALHERDGLPEPAARAAGAVLEYDRRCREVDSFLAGAEAHAGRWQALRAEAGDGVSVIELPDYAPLTGAELTLRDTGQAMLAEDAGYGPHLNRVADGPARAEAALEGLEDHELHDRCAAAIDGLRQAAAVAWAALPANPLHKPMEDAEALEKKRALEEEARERLQAEMEAQAALMAQLALIEQMLRDIAALEKQERELMENAESEELPLSLTPGWEARCEANEAFVEAAETVLGDESFGDFRDARPDLVEEIADALENAQARLSSMEQDLDTAMAEAASREESAWQPDAADFPLACDRDVAVGDLLRFAAPAEMLPGGREEEAGQDVEVVAGVVSRTAAKSELDDACTLEALWRSDGGPEGRFAMPLGMLAGGDCARTAWVQPDEQARREAVEEQSWQLDRSRQELFGLTVDEPHQSLSMTR